MPPRYPPKKSDAGESEASDDHRERLQKVLAAAGVGSRRDCEQYISEGRVEVDRQVVTELGTKVDPQQQEIRVDGIALRRPKLLYFAVNKPVGVVSTNFDPSGRSRVIDLVPTDERVFPIGRLDRGSEGLILVTNDGALANRLTHPRYGVEKTYFVRIVGAPTADDLLKLKRGVHLAEGVARVAAIKVRKSLRNCTDLEIILSEGKNREIRRILARLGHKVMQLRRLAVGPIKLAEMPVGSCRRLLPHEIDALKDLSKPKRRDAKPKSASEEAAQSNAKPKSVPPKPMKPATTVAKPKPAPVATGSGPAKIDLADLLRPGATTPVAKMVSRPPPQLIAPPVNQIGDILPYDDDAETSVPAFDAQRVRRPRPNREKNQEHDLPPPFMRKDGEAEESPVIEERRGRRDGRPSGPRQGNRPGGERGEYRPGKKAVRRPGKPSGKPGGKTGESFGGRRARKQGDERTGGGRSGARQPFAGAAGKKKTFRKRREK